MNENTKDLRGRAVLTPLMKQYYEIKSKYPDAILLFRVGDFYETFEEDAVITSKILGIVLTKRANGSASFVDLAGFPYHALDAYLPKLVKAGYRVAICEQLEDPKFAKTIVKRGITEIVTPGIAFNEQVLDNKSNNFLGSIHFDKDVYGVAFIDVSTGEYFLAEGNFEYCEKLIQTFQPSEVILQKNKKKQFIDYFGDKIFTYTFDDWVFTFDYAYDLLLQHFQTNSLKGFGIESNNYGIIAAGAILHYLKETQHSNLKHISKISRIEQNDFVWMDHFTIRNLELVSSQNQNATTLLQVLDRCATPMGSRLLKKWILMPLKDKTEIEKRLSVVDVFFESEYLAQYVEQELKFIGDLERLASKLSIQKINPRELLHLAKALEKIELIKQYLQNINNNTIALWINELDACPTIKEAIFNYIVDDPPANLQKGGVIASNVSFELDELRKIAYESKDYLQNILQREVQRTGIPSLKISYNNVFGYYLEVTNTHKNKVPADWIRKQTLANAERYITPELKEYEEKILGAEEKILAIEQQLYNDLLKIVSTGITAIQKNSNILAQIDCLLSFSKVARSNNYSRPEVNESNTIHIVEGRHPVIEAQLKPGQHYVPNDIYLDDKTQQIIILTGPNMSGKSALLRQTALICLMAQIGCYVPAKEASIGLVDKIFTRVGASDNITSGESTFMVEMNETASILNNISHRSLILLDEIGRGTSTYDGISIAWAITEFIHEHPYCKAKTLFATHYHELNELSNYLNRCKNFHISVKEYDNKIIFLYKLLPGGSEHSFGIQVAQMAGLPHSVIQRAKEILIELEKKINTNEVKPQNIKKSYGYQLSFIQLDDPLLLEIKSIIDAIDINTITPIEALIKLSEIKNLLSRKKQN